jgi:hypothetical protein
MSSIEEVRAQLEAACEAARQALDGIGAATRSMEEAVAQVSDAARGSGHQKVEESLGAFDAARDRLQDAGGLVLAGISMAEEYASAL